MAPLVDDNQAGVEAGIGVAVNDNIVRRIDEDKKKRTGSRYCYRM